MSLAEQEAAIGGLIYRADRGGRAPVNEGDKVFMHLDHDDYELLRTIRETLLIFQMEKADAFVARERRKRAEGRDRGRNRVKGSSNA